MNKHMHAHAYTHTQHTHMHIHTHTPHTLTHTHTHTRTHTHTHTHTLHTMVYSVMRRSVEDPLQRTQLAHHLGVDPELIDEIELTMHQIHRRWDGQGQWSIKQLRTENKINQIKNGQFSELRRVATTSFGSSNKYAKLH